jgi:hypothetical protein
MLENEHKKNAEKIDLSFHLTNEVKEHGKMNAQIQINRAPVLTLWAAIVAERLGYQPEEALTLAKAITGRTAQAKGRRLGIYEEKQEEKQDEKQPEKERRRNEGETFNIVLLGISVTAVTTKDGFRALEDGRAASPGAVERYLQSKFGPALDDARQAMRDLAGTYSPEELNRSGFRLYEKFRPDIPEGQKGWGARGMLDLSVLGSLKKGI